MAEARARRMLFLKARQMLCAQAWPPVPLWMQSCFSGHLETWTPLDHRARVVKQFHSIRHPGCWLLLPTLSSLSASEVELVTKIAANIVIRDYKPSPFE